MKKITTGFAIVAALLCTSCIRENFSDSGKMAETSKLVGNPFGEKEDGNLLIRLTAEAAKDMAEGTFAYDEVFDGLGEVCVEPLFPGSSENDGHNLHKWYALSFDSSVSVETAAEIVSGNEEIEAVQYNSILKSTHNNESVEYQAVPSTRSSASDLPFDDPDLKHQWNLINDGTVVDGAVAGADVGVKDAWRLTAGDPRVVVAVMDEGVKYDHRDLAKAMWVNVAEKNGKDGVDDDGNGYIDDIHGYNFKDDSGKLTYDTNKKNGDHATHVAGIIAATNNNGINVSSIAGGTGKGDGVRIMSCQIFDERGNKTGSMNVAKAFYYAAKNGASIAQCSYGEDGKKTMNGIIVEDTYKSDSDFMDRCTAEYDALMYFLDPANSNCEAIESNVAIFSSGNYNTSTSLYPGALKGCISVTAICPDYLPGGYSNYGAGCDIAAPGGDIVKDTNTSPCMILSTGITSKDDFSKIDDSVYKFGTSMACPHVSGVVALGMSYALQIGKNFTREDFISRLLTSSVNIDQYMHSGLTKLYYNTFTQNYEDVDISKKKNKMGAGAVNAWNFLMALEGTPVILTQTGDDVVIDISHHIGDIVDNFDFEISIDEASKLSLGLESDPVLRDGKLYITCTKNGSGKIRFSSSVGGENMIEGLDFYKEISIVSRPSVAQNGGWL